jgi:hypothetical protein
MFVTVKQGADFSAGCAGGKISHSIIKTHPLALREWQWTRVGSESHVGAASRHLPLNVSPTNQF